ncbi:MAG: hypothetical protein KBT82_09610 [Marinobacter sp.]|uniref:hypothetical protein n=1 Tax=Marinobacter sp. TaxID=50741 RepID=UPI001B681C91|nr:hypothetical protein [Marinobacter sp.]MBQ0747300.1 hypothetical protein [Marinobacter sp.]MBQ0814412.1 hypothetical protein [Marinobacter sp.]|tara:strand:- start:1068 stop:2102 length:1035 start_codon:yes stop_codon:yes gene_type:complete
MTKDKTDPASQMLELHVKHEVASLKGTKLRKFLKQEVSELLDLAGGITLNRIASENQVMETIQRVVVNMELDAGIPELAGEMATEVLNAPVQSTTALGDIITRGQATGFVEEMLELRRQRERVISEIMAHPVYQELVSNVVYQGVVNYLYEDNLITKSVPGVGSMMKFGKRMANKAVPGLDETFERRLKAWLSDSLPGLINRSEQFLQKALSDDEVRDTVMAAWVAMEDRTLADLQEGLGDVELQTFVVLGYEFWLQFRKTDYFESCARAVVAHLFLKYGDRPLTDLLGDVGVTEDLIMAEVDAWAIPIIDVLREEGYVETLVRRRLAAFYNSAAARRILEQEV